MKSSLGWFVMRDKKPPPGARNDEIIKAFDREREQIRELHQKHTESWKSSHARDRQVLIERRRHPR
jgi:hypothetical protein